MDINAAKCQTPSMPDSTPPTALLILQGSSAQNNNNKKTQTKKNEKLKIFIFSEGIDLPPKLPFLPPGYCGRKSWVAHQRWMSQTK